MVLAGLVLMAYSISAYLGLAPGGYSSVPEPVALSGTGERSARLEATAPPAPTARLALDRTSTIVLALFFGLLVALPILAACLLRAREKNDLPWIGLIGSKSKWATFRHRLEARGFGEADFARVTCPIGLPNITGPFRKQPEVIAVSVAAQLLAL